jgi:CheY-like chemotaxis protein
MGTNMTDGQGEGLRQAGFDSYLTKPFETSALLSLVERHAASVIGS